MMGHDETMIGAETGMTVSMTAVAYLDCFTVYFIFFFPFTSYLSPELGVFVGDVARTFDPSFALG